MSASGSLARGALTTTVATAISRVTGFARVVVVASAMGTTFLANVYQTSNTVPNILFELLAAGVLTSVFVPTFVGYIVRGEKEEGWDAANALASVALAGLIGLSLAMALAAPAIMRLLTIGVDDPALRAREIALGSRFIRLFAPQIALYGAGMIMTGALHAHRRFALPAIAPIANNVVVIAVYLTYAAMRGDRPPTLRGITGAEAFVLGAGTTLGVVAMTVVLVPQLARLGWRFRLRWQPGHPAVRRALRLGAWSLGYAGGYQFGLLVVMVLANKIQGGVAAYQWAYTFFYLPHALFGVPIFNVLFTAMAEHTARGEEQGFVRRLRDGLGMLAFIQIPVAAFLVAAAEPLAGLTLRYGVMTEAGAGQVAGVLQAFALGLPAYSAFLVITRAFYALGDTKTPAVVNALAVVASSATGALLFYAGPGPGSVRGLALGHSIGFAAGTVVLAAALRRKVGAAGGTRMSASLLRSGVAGAAALGAMTWTVGMLHASSRAGLALQLAAAAGAGAVVYLAAAAAGRAPELRRLAALVGRAR